MKTIDPELEKAAISGDVEFLKRAFAHRGVDDVYFLARQEHWGSNIFHIAAYRGTVEFLREALIILPTHLVQQLLSSQQHRYGWNPLHDAAKNGRTEIVRLMLGFYKSYSGPALDNKPWLALSNCTAANNTTKQTPLHFAIEYGHEECALEIMSMDMELLCSMLDENGNSLLFLAVQKGFNRVAEKILLSDCSYSVSGQDGSTALHVASRCSENVTKLLLKKQLDCLYINSMGFIRQWAEEGSIARLELLLDKGEFSATARSNCFTDLIRMNDARDNEISPLHLAMMIPNIEFLQELVDFYQQLSEGEIKMLESLDCSPPWKTKTRNGDTPLHLTISSKLEQHAMYFLKLDPTLCLMRNNKGESPLLIAMDKGCEQVVKEILRVHPNLDYNILRRNDGVTLLHLLKSCSEEIGRQLLGKYWWMINLRDSEGKTALDEARKENVPWLVNLLMNPSLINKEPFDWITACKRNETWAVMEFIYTCNDLEEIYRREIDTPLHHIKLDTYAKYQNILKIPSVKELKNATDREGATPLHIALKRKDINLAKALLVDTEVERNIVDNTGNTALSLLVELYEKDEDWAKMCKLIKVNPYLKTSYIQARTNLDQMRNTLSVVAALLATITFTAGLTVPGGFDSGNGHGILARKAPFIVFLLADVYGMCTSMLVLFCLIWSMISDRDMSYFLVDRSVLILMQSLYGTLLAFMTGIYATIAPESLWVAIIVLVLCSLIGISVNRTVLREIITKLVPVVIARLLPATKKDDMSVELLEEGNLR